MNKRPTYNDVKDEAIKLFIAASEFEGWLGSLIDEDTIDDLKKLDPNQDGYKLARELDSKGWEVDAELVSMFENYLSYAYDDALKAATKQWVIENNIQPQFSIGQAVEFKTRLAYIRGTIASIRTDIANYCIIPESNRGEIYPQHIISFENVSL